MIGRPGHALVLLLALGGPTGAAGQLLDHLQAPSAPGFQILGIHPTAIERPSTPRAFGVSLLSAVGGGSILPENYAVELAPYWLAPHPLLSFQERVDPTFWQGVKQSFAVSLATRPAGEGSGARADSTRIGAGLRVLLLPGRLPAEAVAAKDSLDAIGDRMNRLFDRLDSLPPGPAADSVQATLEELDTLRQRLGEGLADPDPTRSAGVRWELAAAAAAVVPGNRFDDAGSAGWGAWSTVSFRPAGSFDVLGVVRYLRLDPRELGAGSSPGDVAVGEPALSAEQDVLDVGARVLWALGDLELSAELLRRSSSDPDVSGAGPDGPDLVAFADSWRAVANLDYHVSPAAAVSWSLGRGFALEGIDAGQLIAVLGLKVGLGGGLESLLREVAGPAGAGHVQPGSDR